MCNFVHEKSLVLPVISVIVLCMVISLFSLENKFCLDFFLSSSETSGHALKLHIPLHKETFNNFTL